MPPSDHRTPSDRGNKAVAERDATTTTALTLTLSRRERGRFCHAGLTLRQWGRAKPVACASTTWQRLAELLFVARLKETAGTHEIFSRELLTYNINTCYFDSSRHTR